LDSPNPQFLKNLPEYLGMLAEMAKFDLDWATEMNTGEMSVVTPIGRNT
jgi:hypothetical protein